eukprot:8637222-Pyramimonas_sp.AAC.2
MLDAIGILTSSPTPKTPEGASKDALASAEVAEAALPSTAEGLDRRGGVQGQGYEGLKDIAQSKQ